MGCPGGSGPRAFPGDRTVSDEYAQRHLGLIGVLVEAGILEDTGFGGYKVAVEIGELLEEVESLRRRVVRLETEKMLGPQS